MTLEETIDKYRQPLQLFMRITALILLGMAVYIAYTMYQYRDGFNAGVHYMEALNRQNMTFPCTFSINGSGV